MSLLPLIRRGIAQNDVEEATAYYASRGGLYLVGRFIEALESALRRISRHPGLGSTRYAELLRVPGLRCAPVEKFLFLVFYVEHSEFIDVWRVLQAERDVPESLQGE